MQEEQEIYLGRQILRQNGVGGLGFYKTVKACDLYTSIRPKKLIINTLTLVNLTDFIEIG